MCIFKCVGVLRIHLQMHAAKLKEQSSSPKLKKKKKLRRYYPQEASCSLIMLCADLVPGTQRFCGKAKATRLNWTHYADPAGYA